MLLSLRLCVNLLQLLSSLFLMLHSCELVYCCVLHFIVFIFFFCKESKREMFYTLIVKKYILKRGWSTCRWRETLKRLTEMFFLIIPDSLWIVKHPLVFTERGFFFLMLKWILFGELLLSICILPLSVLHLWIDYSFMH